MSWGQGEEELAILKIEKKVGQGVCSPWRRDWGFAGDYVEA